MSARRFRKGQEFILKTMTQLGYKSDYEGVCRGIVGMWSQAVLVGEEDIFLNRLSLIQDLYYEEEIDLGYEIHKAKQKAKEKKSLSERNQQFLDVAAMFEGIELYQQAHHYRYMFNDDVSQITPPNLSLTENKFTTHIVSSKKIEALGGVITFFEETGIGEPDKLQNYLLKVGNAIRSEILKMEAKGIDTKNRLFACSLQSLSHIVGLSFEKVENEWHWVVIDPNNLPRKVLKDDEIGAVLEEYLFYKKIIPYHFRIDCTENSLPNLRSMQFELAKIKKANISAVDREKIKLRTMDNNGIAELAGRFGDMELLAKITEFKEANINPGILSAILMGQHEAILYILDKDAKAINTEDTKGNKVAHYAVKYGQLDLLDHLISKYPVILEQKNNLNQTSLHMAGLQAQVEIFKNLVAAKVDLNIEDKNHNTALDLAYQNLPIKDFCKLFKEIIKIKGDQALPFLQRGVKNKEGKIMSAMQIALLDGDLNLIKRIVESKPDPLERDNFGFDWGKIALISGNFPAFKYLIETFPELLSAIDKEGHNTLQTIIECKQIEAVELALQLKPDLVNVKGNTVAPMVLAADQGNTQLMKKLLFAGAKFDSLNEWSGDPLEHLHGTSRSAYLEFISELPLLLKKANQPAIDQSILDCKDSPLSHMHRAVNYDHAQAVLALLELGASPERKNHAGLNPLELALTEKKWNCAVILLLNSIHPPSSIKVDYVKLGEATIGYLSQLQKENPNEVKKIVDDITQGKNALGKILQSERSWGIFSTAFKSVEKFSKTLKNTFDELKPKA